MPFIVRGVKNNCVSHILNSATQYLQVYFERNFYFLCVFENDSRLKSKNINTISGVRICT